MPKITKKYLYMTFYSRVSWIYCDVDKMLFEYYYDRSRLRTCLNCKHYFVHMNLYQVESIMQLNGIKERRLGQKYCLKNKCFVYLSESCGYFDEKLK